MKYVALLRGINVGGKTRVEMPRLKALLEGMGFTEVKTYINSGNVIFASPKTDQAKLALKLEKAITAEFSFPVPTLVRSQTEMEEIVKQLPASWVNDQSMKCDVMFLWKEIDSPKILEQIPHDPTIEDVIYLPGAVVWRIDRDKVRQGQVLKIVGSNVHKQLTVRNPNTVRKLVELMQT